MNKETTTIEVPAGIAEPGVILRLSQSLGGTNDVFQLEGGIDRDASQAEFDHLADKMARTAARLAAKSNLPGLRRQLENVEYKHNENRRRLAELNAGEDEVTKIRAEKVAELQVRAGQIETQAQEAYRATGRQGKFKPQGHVAGELGKVRSAIASIEEAGVKERNEAQVQRATLENELKDGERAVAQLNSLIRENEALVRGEDISGV